MPRTKANLDLGLGALLLLVLLVVVACILVGHSINSSPLWWLLVLTVALVWWAASARAREKLLKHLRSRGMAIDKVEAISQRERNRLGVPKKAWVIRYHDRDEVEYWLLAVAHGWNYEILRDVPRQVYESKKPEWKEEDGIDLDLIREMAQPSPAQRYLRSVMLATLAREDRTAALDEVQGLLDLPDAPAPATFASLLQAVQIVCRSAETTGSTHLVFEDKYEWLLRFSCCGEPGQRSLTLSLSPLGTEKPEVSAPIGTS